MVIFQIKNWIQVKFSQPKLSLKLTSTQKSNLGLKTPKTRFRLGSTKIANKKKEIMCCFFVIKKTKFGTKLTLCQIFGKKVTCYRVFWTWCIPNHTLVLSRKKWSAASAETSNFRGKPILLTQKPKERFIQQKTNAAWALSSKKWGP